MDQRKRTYHGRVVTECSHASYSIIDMKEDSGKKVLALTYGSNKDDSEVKLGQALEPTRRTVITRLNEYLETESVHCLKHYTFKTANGFLKLKDFPKAVNEAELVLICWGNNGQAFLKKADKNYNKFLKQILSEKMFEGKLLYLAGDDLGLTKQNAPRHPNQTEKTKAVQVDKKILNKIFDNLN